MIIVQNGEAARLCGRSNQQVGRRDPTMPATVGKKCLDLASSGASMDPVEQLHRRQRLQLVLDTYDVLPFDAEVAEFYGLLANVVRQAGQNPRPRRMDLLIAATAVRHGLSLATRNGADLCHLERVLTVIDVD